MAFPVLLAPIRRPWTILFTPAKINFLLGLFSPSNFLSYPADTQSAMGSTRSQFDLGGNIYDGVRDASLPVPRRHPGVVLQCIEVPMRLPR